VGFHKKTINDVPLDNQTVLVRVNYDIPVNNGNLADDLWVRASLPTIENLLERGCKVVVIGHHGSPAVKDIKYSLEPAAARLARLLRRDIRFVSEAVGDRVLQAVKKSPSTGVIVLENLHFYPGEEFNDREFARSLVTSTGARYFVQDGFGVTHKKHASTSAIADFVPSVAGLALTDDYNTIIQIMESTGAKNKLNLPGIDALLDARS